MTREWRGRANRPVLRLAAAQFAAESGNLERNIACHVALLEQAAAQDVALVVFPELSVTGYCSSLLNLDPAACAVDPAGDEIAALSDACGRLGVAAVVGAPLRGDRGLHLSAIVINRQGRVERLYHKMYLDSDERRWFVRGETPESIVVDGWMLGLGICYDSSFPEHVRHYALSGADAYLLSGAFPLGRSDFRRTIYFPARALENTIYLVFANYVSQHDGQGYGGMSAVYGPDGQCLVDAGVTESGLAVLDLDHRRLSETREKLQMLRDCI